MTTLYGRKDESGADQTKLYCFDFDDCLVTTTNCIRTESGPISTAEFAKKKHDVTLLPDAFADFDFIESTTMVKAPAFFKFERAIQEGNPIAIITARSNNVEDFDMLLGKALRLSTTLPSHALRCANITVYSCNSMEFASDFACADLSNQDKKRIAISNFVAKYPNAKSVGFSDDDPDNIVAIRSVFRDMQNKYPCMSYHLYSIDTRLASVLPVWYDPLKPAHQ
jgi:hypothetical protein